MKFVVLRPTVALIDWIKSRLPEEHGNVSWDPAKTFSTVLFDEDDEPVVATAIDGLDLQCCDLTLVSDGTKRWACAEFICGTYDFIFEALGVNRVSMIALAKNEAALRMNKALGHVQEGVHRDYFGPGLDGVSFSFLRSDWERSRWYARSKRPLSVNRTDKRERTHGKEIQGQHGSGHSSRTSDGPGEPASS